MAEQQKPKWGWWVAGAVLALIVWNTYQENHKPDPVTPLYTNVSSYSGTSTSASHGSESYGSGYGSDSYGSGSYGSGYGTDDYGTGGYENPAPGNDGTPDCAPGQGPVYVGNNDPYGLDGDGDGWGCE